MQKTAIVLVLTATMTGFTQSCYANDFQELVSGDRIPLNLQLKNLDNSWRQISTSGQFEMGDLLKTWSTLFGVSDIYNNTYYTKGETIDMGDQTYVVAYRLAPKGDKISFQALIENAIGSGCSESSFMEKMTPETSLTLSLLNLKTVGSLNDISSFNLQETIAASEQARKKFQEACQKSQTDSMQSQAESNLIELGSALLNYIGANDGKLPDTGNPESLQIALQDWVSNESVFINPETSEPFQANASIAGKNLSDIAEPQQIVAFYEAVPAADGTRGVVFLDGSFQRVSATDWMNVMEISSIEP